MNKTNQIPLFLIIFLSIFVPFRELIAFYTIDYIKFLPDLLIWSYAAILIFKNKFRLNVKSYDLLFAFFLILGLVSTLINGVSLLAYALQVRSISTMYVMFYILRNTKLDVKQFRIVGNILMIVSFILVFFSIIEHISSKLWLFPTVWKDNIIYASNFARTYSLMNNPNTFAFFCYMIMLLVFFINRKHQMVIHYVFYGFTFLAILLSASRSTLIVLGLFFAFLIFDCFKKKNYKIFIQIASLMIVAAILLLPLNLLKNATTKAIGGSGTSENISLLDRFEEITTGETVENSSMNGRIFIIKKGIEIFSEHPVFGTGFGTYGSAASKMVTPRLYEKYDLYEKFYSDNEYIKVFVETGLVGTLVYTLFVLSLFKYCLNSKYKILAFLSFLFIGMFYNIFEFQSICFMLYLSFAFIDTQIKALSGKEQHIEAISKKTI